MGETKKREKKKESEKISSNNVSSIDSGSNIHSQILMALEEDGSAEAKIIQKRLIGNEVSTILNSEIEVDGKRVNIMSLITERYMGKFLDPNYKITNQDMLTLRKLNGEEKKITESTKVVKKIDLTRSMLEKARDGDN